MESAGQKRKVNSICVLKSTLLIIFIHNFRREAGRTSTRPDELGSFPRLSSPSRSRCDNSGNTLDVEPLLVQSRPWQLKWQKIKQTRDAVTVHLGLIHSTDRNMILFLMQRICFISIFIRNKLFAKHAQNFSDFSVDLKILLWAIGVWSNN